MPRLFLLVSGVFAISVIPFLIWGQGLEASLAQKGAAGVMRDFGEWAWLVGIGLIILDIALPVPATAIMAALGIIYGLLIGGAASATGSVLGGLAGYGACRIIGPRRAERLAGAEGFARTRALFEDWGGWLVAGSRWLPVLPENSVYGRADGDAFPAISGGARLRRGAACLCHGRVSGFWQCAAGPVAGPAAAVPARRGKFLIRVATAKNPGF